MTLAVQDDGWRLSDARWAQLNPLLPVYHPPPIRSAVIVGGSMVGR